MGWLRSEQEAQQMIEEMKSKTKGKYITQGVTFNKDSERHMELLKYALMYAGSFSGLGKEMLAEKFSGLDGQPSFSHPHPFSHQQHIAPASNTQGTESFF